MDPISVLQSRIEQLEAKLGFNNTAAEGQQGDSATTNLLNAAHVINEATSGNEKLPEAMRMASELNNYTDPNFLENVHQNDLHMKEVAAAEPILKHHCHCMHKCKQNAPVLESEALQQVPQMQNAVDELQSSIAEVKEESEIVSQGIQELANTCGSAASGASEHLAAVAQKVEQAEEKLFPRRRNGLD